MLSGIPQGSILGPLLLIKFINDLVDVCEENIKMYLFADDANMYCHIKNVADKDKLQRGIDNFVDLTSKWQVSLNINKCKIFLRKVTGPKFAHVQTISWGYDESV